jgi:hypothetical protein
VNMPGIEVRSVKFQDMRMGQHDLEAMSRDDITKALASLIRAEGGQLVTRRLGNDGQVFAATIAHSAQPAAIHWTDDLDVLQTDEDGACAGQCGGADRRRALHRGRAVRTGSDEVRVFARDGSQHDEPKAAP